ncbi:MAG: spore cortex-lytic enzyme [Paenibacillus sp. RIFOXYA1_FULL_44_5]|nr:MAG: spore cortex-lytic enzyme [Paenibacillus sp. RIFOXYA1_FULL_44_5]
MYTFSKLKVLVSVALILSLLFVIPPQSADSFSKQIVKIGAAGSDVYELQGRLTYIGYYKGSIDGVFGWKTYNSVRTFQWKFGMKVDGVVGPKTKLMLWKATKNWTPGGSSATGSNQAVSTTAFSSNDRMLLARAVYSEARGEPYAGQVAIAAVIINRLKSPAFPNSISGIIFQPGAFTAVSDGQFWLTPDQEAYKAAQDAVNGWDPSGGAIYYFNPNTATSAWIWSRPQIIRIGNHIFAK